ncbi:AraC-like DNA-binding protein [Lysobacter enzymogenes]|jgi:AraC-like DNA-binding protein|uniref:AraC family transcriptional regulator n=1 Tax=Lysobacter enzymogenes TaxID=69 RepID=A0AAU9AHR1_LYSEN|nr:helix-turn-helix transcriptional regulator [Lysobacter enzymogenes]BAV98174.1 AraC family transcriptional regulator [Lysobacter enzymogenes]
MRNVLAGQVDHLPGRIVATSNEYPSGHRIARHRHRRSQLLYGAHGIMVVGTEAGRWMVPPERAAWIPAGMPHDVHVLAPISTRSIYVEPEVSAALPADCRVIGVSALMRELLLETLDLPLQADTADGSRPDLIYSLIVREIERAPVLPLDIPFPAEPRLAKRCRAYLAHPSPHDGIDDWCRDLAMSRRTFTRRFRAQTGTSFAQWCRQAAIFAALPRLAAGEPITALALDLGYESASAFTTMFKRLIGMPPSRYLATARAYAPAG